MQYNSIEMPRVSLNEDTASEYWNLRPSHVLTSQMLSAAAKLANFALKYNSKLNYINAKRGNFLLKHQPDANSIPEEEDHVNTVKDLQFWSVSGFISKL